MKEGRPKRLTWVIKYLLQGHLDHYGNVLQERHGRLFSFLFVRMFRNIRIDPEKIERIQALSKQGTVIYALPYRSPLGRFGEFWENFYAWWLMWAFNAASLRHRRLLHMRRAELWMSAVEFMSRYGPAEIPSARR